MQQYDAVEDLTKEVGTERTERTGSTAAAEKLVVEVFVRMQLMGVVGPHSDTAEAVQKSIVVVEDGEPARGMVAVVH